jgi:hypothetical protein
MGKTMRMEDGLGGGSMAQPYYCPYCGEQDFVPFGDEYGRFHCRSCDRHWKLRFLGVGGSGDPPIGFEPGLEPGATI